MTINEARDIAQDCRTAARTARDFEVRLALTSAAEAIEYLLAELAEAERWENLIEPY